MSTERNERQKEIITVAGLGLMGGSFAKRLTALGYSVNGLNRTESVMEEALAEGIIETAERERLRESDIVILCMPLCAMISFIRENGHLFKKGSFLTDISGVKMDSIERVREILPEGVDFVSAHPMAGREGSSLSMASGDIFDGCNYIIVTGGNPLEKNVSRMETLARELGAAHVVRVDDKTHDRIIAFTSSLPHAVAVSFMNSESMNDMVRFFVAGSFRDATRVADINARLWTCLFMENRENLLSEIKKFQKSLDSFAKALEDKDTESMEQFLARAGERRRKLKV